MLTAFHVLHTCKPTSLKFVWLLFRKHWHIFLFDHCNCSTSVRLFHTRLQVRNRKSQKFRYDTQAILAQEIQRSIYNFIISFTMLRHEFPDYWQNGWPYDFNLDENVSPVCHILMTYKVKRSKVKVYHAVSICCSSARHIWVHSSRTEEPAKFKCCALIPSGVGYHSCDVDKHAWFICAIR